MEAQARSALACLACEFNGDYCLTGGLRLGSSPKLARAAHVGAGGGHSGSLAQQTLANAQATAQNTEAIGRAFEAIAQNTEAIGRVFEAIAELREVVEQQNRAITYLLSQD
ncbi:hypothetical protein [Synechococcus sp. H55.11]|uniref:hypothetical protein n=1 Tax=unclassified Synechococcus TaxID=2626047 RepID=UPI0039C3880D